MVTMSADIAKRLAAARKQLLAALHALPRSSASSSSTLAPPVPGLPETLVSLLAQLRHTTTAISLAFKPPVTADALAAQLDKAVDGAGRLVSCALATSGVLGEEWADGVRAVLEPLTVLLEVMESTLPSADQSAKADAYLAQTGIVWDAIDKFGADVSRTELQAVGRRWRRDGETVRDAWTEFREFLEDAADDDEDEDGDEDSANGLRNGNDDDDDEWAELERAMGGKQMTREERRRAEAPVLGLHQLLIPSVARYLPLLALDPEEPYSTILDSSTAMLGAFDNAVSSLYPTQDEAEVEAAVDTLVAQATALVNALRERLDRVDGLAPTNDGAATGTESGERQACRTFLGRWEERAAKEIEDWRARRLGMRELKDSL